MPAPETQLTITFHENLSIRQKTVIMANARMSAPETQLMNTYHENLSNRKMTVIMAST